VIRHCRGGAYGIARADPIDDGLVRIDQAVISTSVRRSSK
jgi:hypothetical protein